MKLYSLYAMKTFKMVLEFEQEYRVWNIEQVRGIDNPLLDEVRKDIELFLSARTDEVSGKVIWGNGFELDFNMLFKESIDLELLLSQSRRSFQLPIVTKPLKWEDIPKSISTLELERIEQELLDKIKWLRKYT